MRDHVWRWLAAQLATDLARAVEAATGEQPKVSAREDSPGAGMESTLWRQKFTACSGGAWLAAPARTWISLGERGLRGGGSEPDEDQLAKSAFVQMVGQAFTMLAQSIGRRTGVEWTCTEGGEAADSGANEKRWTSIHLNFADGVEERLFAAFDESMLGDLSASMGLPAAKPAISLEAPATTYLAPDKSKTLDLLLDVELPVSVSFGRAQLPLKDVVKLTTGCIIELNRTIAEPVEVIVNNCVIARGEVVVVDGNFGVRIQEVVSREERLRTLS